jgi:hypothetical protein
MGPHNLMDGYRGFPSGHTTFIIRKAVKIDPDSPSRTFITIYQTIGCPNPGRIMNPDHCGHLKSWRAWKCHILKLKHRMSNMLLEIYYFSINCGQFVSCFVSHSNLFDWMAKKHWMVSTNVERQAHFSSLFWHLCSTKERETCRLCRRKTLFPLFHLFHSEAVNRAVRDQRNLVDHRIIDHYRWSVPSKSVSVE